MSKRYENPSNLLSVSFSFGLTALASFACASGAEASVPSNLDGRVTVDGSSTVYPLTGAVAEEFGKAARRVKVTIGVSGTGGGFKRFCDGQIDISHASRPIQGDELQDCQRKNIEFIELPIAYDPLTVVINPKNTFARSMTVAELKKLWSLGSQGKITHWNHIRSNWPNEKLALFGSEFGSGTFHYFTGAIGGTPSSSRRDFTSSDDHDVLVEGVAGNENSLGILGMSYYLENQAKLVVVGIDDENPANGEGAVLPTIQAVQRGLYQPLSRPLFVYVRKSALSRPEVREFVKFYLENSQALAREVGYVALPSELTEVAKARMNAKTVGTVFQTNGHAIRQPLSAHYLTPEA